MSEEYEELLDQNVDEAEKSIRDLEDPDYEQLLELEKEGKDRKTIKEFLENKMEKQTEEQEEEIVEEIEEETEGGFLGSFGKEQILAGGVIAGVIIGALAGFAVNMDNGSNAAEVRQSMNQLFEATGNQPDSLTVTPDNGMYLVEVNSTVETQNGTRSASQSYYVSPNGEVMFLTRSRLGTQTYFNVDEVIQRAQQQSQPETNTTNQTQ